MTPDEIRDLIAEARTDISDAERCEMLGVTPSVGTLLRMLRKTTDALAALTTGQEIDAPSVREAIGEVLADMEAVIDGVPVASDLVALQEITDAAIRAAISPLSRTAKRAGYEEVGHAVGGHSQKITALAALTTPQEGDAREQIVEYLRTQNVFTGETSTKVAEEQTRKIFAIIAAFPVLSRDIAGEIEAESDEEVRESAHDEFYVRGLRRAAEIVRNGR